jgi:hypothetical protein
MAQEEQPGGILTNATAYLNAIVFSGHGQKRSQKVCKMLTSVTEKPGKREQETEKYELDVYRKY